MKIVLKIPFLHLLFFGIALDLVQFGSNFHVIGLNNRSAFVLSTNFFSGQSLLIHPFALMRKCKRNFESQFAFRVTLQAEYTLPEFILLSRLPELSFSICLKRKDLKP